jgi:hypothetical protein
MTMKKNFTAIKEIIKKKVIMKEGSNIKKNENLIMILIDRKLKLTPKYHKSLKLMKCFQNLIRKN